MRGWHISIVVIFISLSVLAVSLFYFRPIANQLDIPNIYLRWKALAALAIVALVVGVALLIVPERLWWNP
ncbi:MAG: hypothetical protein Fur002_15920 [Anaerolineales bacterium]